MTLHTPLCDLLGIEFPIIQAGMGMGSSAELAVAVSNAGGLGSLGCWRRPPADLEKQLSVIRERTSRPFAMNHLVPELDETAFAMTLAAKPAVISFALGATRQCPLRSTTNLTPHAVSVRSAPGTDIRATCQSGNPAFVRPSLILSTSAWTLNPNRPM